MTLALIVELIKTVVTLVKLFMSMPAELRKVETAKEIQAITEALKNAKTNEEQFEVARRISGLWAGVHNKDVPPKG